MVRKKTYEPIVCFSNIRQWIPFFGNITIFVGTQIHVKIHISIRILIEIILGAPDFHCTAAAVLHLGICILLIFIFFFFSVS